MSAWAQRGSRRPCSNTSSSPLPNAVLNRPGFELTPRSWTAALPPTRWCFSAGICAAARWRGPKGSRSRSCPRTRPIASLANIDRGTMFTWRQGLRGGLPRERFSPSSICGRSGRSVQHLRMTQISLKPPQGQIEGLCGKRLSTAQSGKIQRGRRNELTCTKNTRLSEDRSEKYNPEGIKSTKVCTPCRSKRLISQIRQYNAQCTSTVAWAIGPGIRRRYGWMVVLSH